MAMTKREKAIKAAVGPGKAYAFDDASLKGNLEALLADLIKAKPATAKGQYLQKVSVSSTMGPGVAVDQSSLALK